LVNSSGFMLGKSRGTKQAPQTALGGGKIFRGRGLTNLGEPSHWILKEYLGKKGRGIVVQKRGTDNTHNKRVSGGKGEEGTERMPFGAQHRRKQKEYIIQLHY